MTPRPAFDRDMEAAARVQLGNALSQHLDAEACITFATASLGREHEALVRRVWADMGKIMWGGGLMFRARWNGETLTPTGHYGLSAAREAMEPGDVVIVEVDHPRSINSHRHQFAEINEAWRHLPESLQDAPWAASPDTMRKHALIVTGFADSYTIDCGARATAERIRMALVSAETGKHGYAIAQVRGPVVTVWTPQSQSMRAMGAKPFQASKEAVLNWIAAQIGVEAEELQRAG